MYALLIHLHQLQSIWIKQTFSIKTQPFPPLVLYTEGSIYLIWKEQGQPTHEVHQGDGLAGALVSTIAATPFAPGI